MDKNSKEYREYIIKTAMGIQGSSSCVSAFFKKQAQKYIDGEISLKDLSKNIESHYEELDKLLLILKMCPFDSASETNKILLGYKNGDIDFESASREFEKYTTKN